MKRFYGNGKLFVTGEYVVLDGGIAFALPTRFGQSLEVTANGSDSIRWKSFDADGSIWFDADIAFDAIRHKTTSPDAITQTLLEILQVASEMNPALLEHGWQVETHLTFPRNWGLGTSSTLIYNIGQWLEIDAFALLRDSFGGSGYDIACAGHDRPIFYRKTQPHPQITEVDFDPAFKGQLYFVYLNQKQSSKTAIAAYRSKQRENQQQIQQAVAQIDGIAHKALKATTALEFGGLLEENESILAGLLEELPVKQKLFADFNGTVKSLGGWGGDFVMVVAENDPSGYFKSKGYETIIPYSEMVL